MYVSAASLVADPVVAGNLLAGFQVLWWNVMNWLLLQEESAAGSAKYGSLPCTESRKWTSTKGAINHLWPVEETCKEFMYNLKMGGGNF